MKQLKIILYIVFVLGFVHESKAQAKNDYNWILGYLPNHPESYFGGVQIDFNQDFTSPKYFETKCNALAAAVLSSNSGKLLAYSNGCSIFNRNHEIMIGGDTIAGGSIWDSYCEDLGYPGTQNHILLPWPGDTSKAILFYLKSNENITTYHLLYATMQFDSDHPLGFVVQKDKYLLNPGTTALLTATKHANGRDWWFLIPEDNTNRFFTFLLDPIGITKIDSQRIGIAWEEREWASQAIFTPDGRKYIRFNPWKGLDIFDFDRCTGALSNPLESGPFSDPVIFAGGVATSDDSRYLFVANGTVMYQFDLVNENILESKVIIDTFDGFHDPFATTFYQMALAPDGKIYVFCTNGVKSIGVINNPKAKGDSCNFTQHSLKLPTYNSIGAVNLPYFRLGPDDASSCDTLGLNNLPIADFRYEIDTINPLKVSFRNLSYFEPETFYWTFGNTMSSTLEDSDPMEYASYDKYEVCLTVANQYGENIFCRIVDLTDTISAVNPFEHRHPIVVKPNPFQSDIYITLGMEYTDATIDLFSSLGEPVYHERLTRGENTIHIPSLPDGLYFYQIREKGIVLKTGKIVKVDKW